MGRNMRVVLWIACGILLVLFLVFVEPTPYRYSIVMHDDNPVEVRVNRFTEAVAVRPVGNKSWSIIKP